MKPLQEQEYLNPWVWCVPCLATEAFQGASRIGKEHKGKEV